MKKRTRNEISFVFAWTSPAFKTNISATTTTKNGWPTDPETRRNVQVVELIFLNDENIQREVSRLYLLL